MRVPVAYLVVLAVLFVIAGLVTLVFFSVPPFDNLQIFILTNVVGFFTLLILGVVGGAFVGMLLAQRMLGNRDFSPFERDVLNSLHDLRDRLDRLEAARTEDDPRLRR